VLHECYAIGLDLGTSACKGVAVTPDGRVLAESRQGYGMATEQPGWAEQDPADWWRALTLCVRTISERLTPTHGQPSAIGVTGQMHGLIAVDAAGAIIRPCILWCDYRATAEARQVAEVVGRERLSRITYNDSRPAFTAPKLLWLRANELRAYARLAHVVLPKDWIVHRLTHGYTSDPSDASGTGLFDIGDGQWSAEIINRLGLDPAWFPTVRPSASIVGDLREDAAAELGLEPGIPVIAGAGDQAAAAVASGATADGVVACSLGTSAALTTTTTQPCTDAFAHAVPDRWLLLTSMHAGGVNLDWWAAIVGGRRSSTSSAVEQTAALARTGRPGADGVTFLPFLMGERDRDAQGGLLGCFIGLRIEHGPAQLARAVLEGVCYEVRRMLQAWRDRGVAVETLRLSGGAARLPVWVQILADVLAMPVEVMPAERSGAFGAALLALRGAGRLHALDLVAIAAERPAAPIVPRAATAYEAAYRHYVYLYDHLTTLSHDAYHLPDQQADGAHGAT